MMLEAYCNPTQNDYQFKEWIEQAASAGNVCSKKKGKEKRKKIKSVMTPQGEGCEERLEGVTCYCCRQRHLYENASDEPSPT